MLDCESEFHVLVIELIPHVPFDNVRRPIFFGWTFFLFFAEKKYFPKRVVKNHCNFFYNFKKKCCDNNKQNNPQKCQ